MGIKNDRFYMLRAIELAFEAKASGDTPFGSILVGPEGDILMEDRNTQIIENDITDHPELKIAKRAAAEYDDDFLRKCTMYNSAEPCTMCTGAIYWSGIGRIVFGISKKRLHEITESEGSIEYSIHDLLGNSGKDFEVVGPMEDMQEEVEAPHN